MSAIVLPKRIFELYRYFENAINHPFKIYKPQIENTFKDLKIMTTTMMEMNLYYIDFNISKEISPSYVMKYIKDVNIRNACSNNMLKYKAVIKNSDLSQSNKWNEEETYKDSVNNFICFGSKFNITCYTEEEENEVNDTSSIKYYISYKILSTPDNYILRFEIAVNSTDMDQEIDIYVYINMITNIIKAIYTKFKIQDKDKK
jgi:hypothetical protein